MIVPRYWAEGRVQHRERGKQVTVRRFGWSDHSLAEAQTHADSRAGDALARLLSGETVAKREPKIPYNGANGCPIREEIVDQRGETVVTRNSYGALCLNTPDILFADIDFKPHGRNNKHFGVFLLLFVIAMSTGGYGGSALLATGLGVAALILSYLIAHLLDSGNGKPKIPPEEAAMATVRAFIEAHPAWNFRVYRTPAGLRLMATHSKFDPTDPALMERFKEIRTDRIYSLMCRNQRCFRARVSPKPWRIGIGDHMRPRPGTWPINPEHLPARKKWIERYEQIARDYSSCTFIESIGSGVTMESVLPVQHWHDELSGALSGKPFA